MGDTAISVRNVAKRFHVFENERARLVHLLFPGRRKGLQEIWALRDVDFTVERGDSVAIIGRNGGGKSTLLQIITGTLEATSGTVEVRGRVSALLELGSGFNPEYTGRDNVILNGLLLGLTREQILRRFDEILAFAEIGDAVDRPVKTYSSGMMMRLAFAVQVLTDPEILIVDEALSVGDFFFQQKCFAYIRSLRERGVTLMFVSHDMGTVRDMCSRAVYLKDGRLRYYGDSGIAIRQYLAEKAGDGAHAAYAEAESPTASADELAQVLRDRVWAGAGDWTSMPAGRLIAVAFYDAQGRPSTSFRLGGALNIKVAYRPLERGPTHVAVVIRNKFNQVVTSLGSSRLGLHPPKTLERDVVVFDLTLDLLLEAGNYSIAVSLSELTMPNQGTNVESTPLLGPIAVHWDYEKETAPFLGMVGLPSRGAFRIVGSPSQGACKQVA